MLERIMTYVYSVREREEGQALVEYALILALIAVFALGSLTILGENVDAVLSSIANAIASAIP